MSLIFFGDSLTEGSNSMYSFTDFLEPEYDVFNFGISGTTIGEYSIYPVDGHSLLNTYNTQNIKEADYIFLEYGINDVSSIMCDFTDMNKVLISFVKALDGIKQLNNHAKIYFLSISSNYGIIEQYAECQCKYLSCDYFQDYDFIFPASIWAGLYQELIDKIGKKLLIIDMIEDVDFLDKYLSVDHLHPNARGHKIIAKKIQWYL